jgi:nucleotide-binding universal stress UspA family protein
MGYDRILVPLDGSHLAEYILPHVEATAHAFNAEVMFLHVIDERAGKGDGLTPSQKEARADISRYLEAITEALCHRRVDARWQVSFGDAAEEIARAAEESKADLIIMSTHGTGSSEQVRMGSVVMAVVSKGDIPVMTIAPPMEVQVR